MPSQHVRLPAKSLRRTWWGWVGRTEGTSERSWHGYSRPPKRHSWSPTLRKQPAVHASASPAASSATRTAARRRPPAPALPLAANLAGLPAGGALGNDARCIRIVPVGVGGKERNDSTLGSEAETAQAGVKGMGGGGRRPPPAHQVR